MSRVVLRPLFTHKPYPIYDQNSQTRYIFQTKTAKTAKNIPFGAAFNYYSLYKGLPLRAFQSRRPDSDRNTGELTKQAILILQRDQTDNGSQGQKYTPQLLSNFALWGKSRKEDKGIFTEVFRFCKILHKKHQVKQ